MPSSAPRLARQEAPDASSASPAFLAVAMVPVVGARSNSLDRHVLAVLGYRQGNRSRYVRPDALLERWPAWMPKPCARALRVALRRLHGREVVEMRDGGFRLNRDFARAASERSCRFRYVERDFDGALSPAAIEFVAMVRGRAIGRQRLRGDAAGFLAELLGSDERTVRRCIEEATAAERLRVVGHYRLRTGHRLPMFETVETVGKPSLHKDSGEERSPDCADRLPGCADRLPDNPYLRVQTSLRSDYLAAPRPLALLTWSEEARPAAPEQSRASGADDSREPRAAAAAEQSPIPRTLPPFPSSPRVVPSWVEIEGLEAAAAAAVAGTWLDFDAHLHATVRRMHLATSTVDGLDRALVALGVCIPWKRLDPKGLRGLRRTRKAMAEALVLQRVEPSTLLEIAFIVMRRRLCETPKQLAKYVLGIVGTKDRAYVERSNDRVARGDSPLPMSAAADALHGLVQSAKQPVGSFQYPRHWWADAVPQDVHDRVTDVRKMIAALAAGARPVEDRNEVAAAMLHVAITESFRAEKLERMRADDEATARRQRGRIIGAALAKDWRRLLDWLPAGMTAADVATLSGVDAETIAAGIASVRQRRAIA